MPGLFSRIKSWIDGETLTAADLNTEFNNIINNLEPDTIDDASSNLTNFQATSDPGEVGTESLPTSLQAELRQLRFAHKEVTGKTQWYESPTKSIETLNSDITATQGLVGVEKNRVVSGRSRTSSNQPVYLTPDGSANSATLKAAATNLALIIDEGSYTISSDISKTGLGVTAGGAADQCLVNDTNLTDQEFTKQLGEVESVIPVDTMGANISAKIGQYAAFKKGSEVFIAYVKSSTELTAAYRGWFFDSSDAPIVRETLADGDTITLLQLTWFFMDSDGSTLDVTNNPPVYSSTTPGAPSTGDYWFDYANETWKRYDGGSFVDVSRTLVGMTAQDSANCIAARSVEFFGPYKEVQKMRAVKSSNSVVIAKGPDAMVNVYGNTISMKTNDFTWDMASDLDGGVSEAADTAFYFYIKDSGDQVISDQAPHMRRDLCGYYHPHNPWRAICAAYNNSSSDLDDGSVVNYDIVEPTNYMLSALGTSSFSTSSTSPADITNAEIYFPSSGKPVLLTLVYDQGNETAGSIFGKGVTDGGELYLYKNGVEIGQWTIGQSGTAGQSIVASWMHIDFFSSPGLNHYQLKASKNGTGAFFCTRLRLAAVEL